MCDCINIRWSNGRKSKLLIKDDQIKYKGRWYNYRNFRNDHYKTTTSTISFILDDVPCANFYFPWNPQFSYYDPKDAIPVSYKITFYYDRGYWKYQSGYITGPLYVQNEIVRKFHNYLFK